MQQILKYAQQIMLVVIPPQTILLRHAVSWWDLVGGHREKGKGFEAALSLTIFDDFRRFFNANLE